MKAAGRGAKRVVDLALSLAALLILSPVALLAAAAIFLEDRGSVLYRQERWGKGGKAFMLYKFRTMTPPSPAGQRVTRIGRLLRGTGLDEVPQFLNILKGDMSLVGPRPLALVEEVELDGRMVPYSHLPGFAQRASVLPGLTGLATVRLPKTASARKKFEYDLKYVRERSLWLDLRLIASSIAISLGGRWEKQRGDGEGGSETQP